MNLFSFPNILVFGLVVLLILGFLYYKYRRREFKDADIPMPSVLRDDILFGHYSSLTRTYDQVKDHVNLYWGGFHGDDVTIRVLREGLVKVLITFDFAVCEINPETKHRRVRADAEENLRAHFQKLRDAGVLDKVSYLYPIDEPNGTMESVEEHLKMILLCKKVAAEFPELANARWAVIYMNRKHGRGFELIEHYDVVGVDYYAQKSESLTIGEHAELVKQLRPNQKLIIVPGSGYGHNPDPWVAYAHTEPRVEIVASFLWFEWEDPANKDDEFSGLEAQSEENRERWIDAAFKVRNKERNIPRIPGVLPSWLEAKAAWDESQKLKS